MEFGSDVLYVSKELEEEEIEELDYYSPSAAPAPGSYASAPVKTKYKPSKSAKYKDDGEVSPRPPLGIGSGMSKCKLMIFIGVPSADLPAGYSGHGWTRGILCHARPCEHHTADAAAVSHQSVMYQ